LLIGPAVRPAVKGVPALDAVVQNGRVLVATD
jgi:hypothetical protein